MAMKRRAALSISSKILLWILPPVIIAMTVSVLLHNHFLEQELVAQAQASAQTYSDIIREAMVTMMVTNYRVDESFLRRLHAIEGLDSLKIILNDLHLREDLLNPRRLERLQARKEAYGIPDSAGIRVVRDGEAAFTRNGDHFRATVPFKATTVCQECHSVDVGYTLGAADIHLTLNQVSASVESSWSRSILIFVLFLAASLAVGVIAFRRVVTEPVEDLVHAARELERGNLDHTIAPPESRDEMHILAVAFEDMRRSLKDNLHELARVNDELARKNASLQKSFEALHKAQNELVRSERLSAVGKMASSIIHDFKNPMTVIFSYAERLKNHPEMAIEMRTRAFDAIARAMTHMTEMTHDLLDFSRGQLKLNLQNVSTEELVQDVRESVDSALQKGNVTFAVERRYQGDVRVDVSHFRRALINLIINAQEAMPSGGRVGFCVQRSNGYAEFSISDSGVGIPEEIKDHIFDAFVTHGKTRGTGLGLAITKLVVQEHGGKIEVQSTVGRGTTFSVFIPLHRVEVST